MTDKETLREFFSAFVITSGVFGVLMLILSLTVTGRDTAPQTRLTVVDTYNGCDVVRYTDPGDARYHYFLDCSGGKNQ